MKITAIKQQIKNPERVSIFIDGKYSFSLSFDELLEQKIRNNQELDEPRLAKLKKLSADGKLRMRALEWALNRPRSLREFGDYLRRKKVDPGFGDALAADFLKRGYLSEPNFARWLVDVRTRGGKSNRAIAAELASKGISRELADEALGLTDTSETERLQQVIAKKAGLSRYQANPQKFIEYLARQGFSYDLIKEQLKQPHT